MNSGMGGPNGKFPMEGVGGCDIDRVDLPALEDVFEVVVVAMYGEAILAAQGTSFGRVARNERHELAVCCSFERR
jgi:hypothetical protein